MSNTRALRPAARATTRFVAGAGALLLAITGLTALTTTAAYAETDSNSLVSLTVDVSPTLDWYTTDTDLTFTVSVTSLNAMDCDTFEPTLTWSDSTTAQGSATGPSMTVPRGKQAEGTYTFRGSVFPNGCNENGGQLTVAKTIEIEPAVKSVSGLALQGNVPPTDYDDYEPEAGVTVALLAADGGPSGTPVDTDVTEADGLYTLTASNASEADADRAYKIRFTYPDSTVVYYDGALTAWVSSTSDWDEAATTTPRQWYSVTRNNGLVTSAPPPSLTNEERSCDYDGSEAEWFDFETDTVSWEDICETDPMINEAETNGTADHSDALDGFGYIAFPQPTGDDYEVTADDYETNESGGVLTTVLHDDDIYLAESGVTVDVTVTRTFQGSFVKWVVEVRDADTSEIVDVPFYFWGELGSDDSTVWTGSGAWRVSDDGSSYEPDGDPVLAHHVSASSFDWETESGDDYSSVEVQGGQLTYMLAVLDYSDCSGPALREAAGLIAQAMPGNFGTEPAPLVGECTTTWAPAPVFGELRMGVPFDQTFPVNAELDWSGGGSAEIEGLPSGLDYDVLDSYVDDTAPQLRVYGTPESEGDFQLTFWTWNDSSTPPFEDAVRVTITVLPGDGPSGTHESRLCEEEFPGSLERDYETASVFWEGVCLTDPTIDEADTKVHGLSDAFDGFGYVVFDQGSFDYVVTADDHTSTDLNGVLTTVIQDDDVVLLDGSIVDVTVTRTIQGSFARWVVEVRDSVTGDIVDAPFFFGGNFGSDSGTTWNGSGDWRTSDDELGYDPLLAHHAVGATAESVTWHGDYDGNDDLTLEVDGGELTYTVAVLDYGICDDDFIRDAGAEIAQAMDANFGRDITLSGDCNPDWPLPVVNEMRAGTPFDQTFTVDSTALDWTHGGGIYLVGVPEGLDWEVLHSWEDGTAPQLRIFGIPAEAGPYAIGFRALDDWGSDQIELVGTILAPVQSSNIHLNFGLGDQVGGGTADILGTGLKSGSEFSVVVQSTPQTIGSGTIGADLTLNSTVTLPTNLGAGWHTITLNGTFFDGSALTDRLWIKIGADGTLLEISTTAPAAEPGLAATGADAASGVALALALLLLGGLALLLWRRRTI